MNQAGSWKKRPQAINAVNAEGAAELAYTPRAKRLTAAILTNIAHFLARIKNCGRF
jgi:hypothetical protein